VVAIGAKFLHRVLSTYSCLHLPPYHASVGVYTRDAISFGFCLYVGTESKASSQSWQEHTKDASPFITLTSFLSDSGSGYSLIALATDIPMMVSYENKQRLLLGGDCAV